MRVDIWEVYRIPDAINTLVRISVEMAPLRIAYQETDNNRHVNIARCPCNESVKHEGGGDTDAKNKWHIVENEPTYYRSIWMGGISMRSEHLVRAIRDLEESGG